MDFLKILKSFEDFVYEALIWLILLPKTLVRIVLRPRQMVAYVQAEQTREGDDRYGDAISPPLLLILCVLVSHVFDLVPPCLAGSQRSRRRCCQARVT